MRLVRLTAVYAVLTVVSFAAFAQEGEKLTLDRVYDSPALSGPSPRATRFSPDGALLGFTRAKEDDALQLDLWAYDVETGEERLLVDATALGAEDTALSEAEKARRERQRQVGLKGVVSYQWANDSQSVLVPLGGDLYLAPIDGGEAQRLTRTEAFEIDPTLSPEGGYVAYIRDGALILQDIETGEETQATPDAEDGISYGVAEFVAQEEMNRFSGYWLAPGDRFVAFAKVDERDVKVTPRYDIGAGQVEVIEQRYPYAGEANAVVTLFVFDRETGSTTEMTIGSDPEQYLARVNWSPDGDRLYVQTQNRAQDRIDLLALDPVTGEGETVLSETSQSWVNLTNDFTPLTDSPGFLWTSERTGFRHIYLYDGDGAEPRALTAGDWVVDRIAGVDEAAERVYFEGWIETPLERHLYGVSYADADARPTRITQGEGWWSATLNGPATAFVGQYSDPETPPQTALYGADGVRRAWIEENALNEDHPYAPYAARRQTPDYGTLTAEDGSTLYYAVTTPPDFDPDQTYPALLLVYGGPHVQTVRKSWGSALEQVYLEHGYVVFRIDNRGSWNRGLAFESVIHRNMGDAEVRDQLVGLNYLKSLPYVDGDRIGVTGWSYGGYMTLKIAQAAGGDIAAAVSGAPVTRWGLYDTHYTERYMGAPQDNVEGYERSSALGDKVEQIEADLMLIHGMADDNVFFSHATELLHDLQQRGVPFDMMVYPGERHGVRSNLTVARHVAQSRLKFFNQRLGGGGS
ncbi:MAG: DPP IV N-terminal domain-containing protein [Maricaulaceae bacterium]